MKEKENVAPVATTRITTSQQRKRCRHIREMAQNQKSALQDTAKMKTVNGVKSTNVRRLDAKANRLSRLIETGKSSMKIHLVAVVTSSTCSLRRPLREKRARTLKSTYLPHAAKDRLPRLVIEAGKTTAGMRRNRGAAGQVMRSRLPQLLA